MVLASVLRRVAGIAAVVCLLSPVRGVGVFVFAISDRLSMAARRFPRAYSYRNASMGCIREAFRAGKNPDTTPTIARIVAEIIITLIEACRKIAPSWSVVL